MSEPVEKSPQLPQATAEEIDYRETADITSVHAAIAREHHEPVISEVAMPLWLVSVLGVTLLIAGFYLGSYNGSFSGEIFSPTDVATAAKITATAAVGTTAGGPAADSPAVLGKRLYSQNCVTCHQATGLGQANVYPPLVKAEYVVGGSKRLVMILLKGLQGPLNVLGQNYNNVMPAWETTLNDKKIASILTYIRQEWGNSAGPITPEQVAAGRKEFASRAEPWAEADLLAVPADAELPGGEAAPAAAPAPAAAEAGK
jgi:mono/diheme cytochrome c family protein